MRTILASWLASCALLVGCANGVPTVGSEVLVPQGYSLIEASSYGQYVSSETLYVRNDSNGRVFELNGTQLGRELVFPEGYALAAVSAYGRYVENRTFYCKKISTGRYFKCNPR